MKRILIAFAVLMTNFSLTGFVINKQTSPENGTGYWTYYTWVTGYEFNNWSCKKTASTTLYIYYNDHTYDRRVYKCSTKKNDPNPPYRVERNPFYKDYSVANCTKDYKYYVTTRDGEWFFKNSLPHFEE